MHYFSFILLIAILLPVFAQADEYRKHIDDSLARMEAEVDKECKHINSVGKMMQCRRAVRQRQTATGDRRATEAYCKKHYFPLDNKALEEKYNELATLRRTARGVGDIRKPHKGEMAQTSYAVEAGCVARELKRRGVKTGYERRY